MTVLSNSTDLMINRDLNLLHTKCEIIPITYEVREYMSMSIMNKYTVSTHIHMQHYINTYQVLERIDIVPISE